MVNSQKQMVHLIGHDGSSSDGEVEIHYFDVTTRGIRTVKRVALLWGLALLSVLIPLAHFILVPAFFIAGVIMIPSSYGETSKVIGGKGYCPMCKADFKIERNSNSWPLDDICAQCRTHVKIEKLTNMGAI